MKGKASGWTAFDLKQKQKQGLDVHDQLDPFPPVTSTSLHLRDKFTSNHDKSFSSLLLPFPENKKDSIPPVNGHDSAIMKLKEIYSWADDSLISDILLSTDDNIEMAFDFLQGMVPARISPDKGNTSQDPTSKIEGYSSDNRRLEYKTSGKTVTNSVKVAKRSTFEYDLQESGGSSFMVNAYDSEKFSGDISELDSIIQRFQSIPVEPEWEEDDLYLCHRKDALKMMRSASNHSRLAQSAFLRGDHGSAKYHSEKAKEDWLTAEKLNAEAAKKILGITNMNNDIWKLDLHGLHATEALQVLQQRLQEIEGKFTVNRSVSPNRGTSKNATVRSTSQEPFGRLNVDHQRTSRELRNSLQVITGIGKHSRGHASLPLAVKTFFEDNRYRFDETRPGVITVRPKFRHR